MTLPNVEIPLFDERNPRVWIRSCDKYFSVHDTPDEQKIEVASLFFKRRCGSVVLRMASHERRRGTGSVRGRTFIAGLVVQLEKTLLKSLKNSCKLGLS